MNGSSVEFAVGYSEVYHVIHVHFASKDMSPCADRIEAPFSGKLAVLFLYQKENSTIQCIPLTYIMLIRWVNCDHNGMNVVSTNTQMGCGIQMMLDWYV